MGLADDLLAPPPPLARCPVKRLLESLPEADAAALHRALAMPTQDMPSATISKRLRAHGHDLSGQTICRHRNGACKCPR